MIAEENRIPLFAAIVVTSVLFHGCTDQGFDRRPNEEIVTFPLIKECEEDVTSALAKFKEKGISSFEYKIEKFSTPLLSHPSVIGVVTLKSMRMEKRQLVMLANNPVAKCYPNVSFSIPVMDKKFGDKFQNEYRLNSRMGISKYYIYVDNGELTAYFRDSTIGPENE